MIEQIMDRYDDEVFMTADWFDEAIIGLDDSSMRIIYSVSKVMEILQRDMDEEEAREHFDCYNVKGAYMGERMPIWCEDDF